MKTATIETSKGTIKIELHADKTPKTVENFETLAGKGFYNGLKFHRVIADFMIQGGCPNGNGMGGPGYNIDAEFNDTPHVKGVLSMARAQDPNSAGSQFFICQGGVWTEDAAFMDESCDFDGFDFAYGCVDDGEDVIFECGDGSGDACSNDAPASCVDQDQIAYCQFGKETWDSCQLFCEEVGIEGVTYEYGECDDSIPDDVACFCCDSGDDGCPV